MNNNNTSISSASAAAQSYTAQAHDAWVNSIQRDAHRKEEQLKYLKRVAELRDSSLACTVLVDNVHDLKNEKNLKELRRFFQRHYGPVDACFLARKMHTEGTGRIMNPPARVRFRHEKDARRVLTKKSLSYPKEKCRDGSGRISVTKSRPYTSMMKTVLESSEIELTANSLALGYYIPNEDYKSNAPWRVNRDAVASREEWLEEVQIRDDGVVVRINLAKRVIELEVPRHGDDAKFDFRNGKDYATIRFKEVAGPVDICRCDGSDRYSLVFSLKHPPKFHSDTPSIGLGFAVVEQDPDRQRSLSFGDIKADTFGRCCGLKLNVSEGSIERLLLSKGLDTLRAFGVIRHDLHSVEDARTIASKQIPKEDETVKMALEELHQSDATVGFLLRSVLDQGKFCWYDALHDTIEQQDSGVRYNLFNLLEFLLVTGANHVVVQALSQILKSHERTRFPCRLFKELANVEAEKLALPEHCVSIPRVLLTPSRQLVVGFEVETSNRVVREFVEHHGFSSERFLRVNIGDENGSKLFWSDLTEPLQSRIRSSIISGLSVNGKLYQFLAYSSSQLKECSIWTVDLGGTSWTVEMMRQSMGDFSKCVTPSKFAARMGQCFSTTFRGLHGHDAPEDVESSLRHVLIKDIISSRDGVFHSDGNGLIRRSAMTNLLKQIPSCHKNNELNHSIVQIRYGGAKGTLTGWENDDFDAYLVANGISDPSLYDLAIRDSMVKFDAKFTRLEVCSIGSNAPYYLNRNVILLLCFHGVKDKTFVNMQAKMLDDLDSMLESPLQASRMISRLGGPDQGQRTRLLNMLRCGLTPSVDPFVFACCLAIRSHHIFGLRKKARIHVEDGAVLTGGIDVLNVLPEYCVFVQVRKASRDNPYGTFTEPELYEPIIGPIMVTKHPVMHPGDVRMLLAVDLPELRNHKNMIIFSQRGSRPEADKMGGSDLDGDEFAVTWDPRLFLGEWNMCKGKRWPFVSSTGRKLSGTDMYDDARVLQHGNRKPLNYSHILVSSPQETLRMDDEGLVQHFINFARRDNLGQIGMLWQDWASLSGADCRECNELAKQHAVAVDFAKTGILANIPDISRWRKTSRAHWREKKDESSYHCKSVIGKLYDQVTGRNDLPKLSNSRVALAGRTLDRYGQVLSIVSDKRWAETELVKIYDAKIPSKLGWTVDARESDRKLQIYLESLARDHRFAYEEKVVKVMNKFSLRNEGELFTGCIRKYHQLHKRRQHEFAEEVRRQGREICRECRSNFFREVLEIANASTMVQGNKDTIVVAPPPGFEFLKEMDLMLQEEDPIENGPLRPIMHTDFEKLESLDHATEISDDDLRWAEEVATDDRLEPGQFSRAWMVRKVARLLAAAGYMVTYSPWRETHDEIVLFGFPWVVSDVIASGVADSRATP